MYDIEEFENPYFPGIPHYRVTYDNIGFASRDYLDCVMFVLDRKSKAEYYEAQANLEYKAAAAWCSVYGCE